MTGSSKNAPSSGSLAAEGRMSNVREDDVPGREALPDLGQGGAHHRLLLLHGGGAQPALGDEGLGGKEPLARARGPEPRGAVSGEDHALQHIADGGGDGGALLGGEPREAIGQERPREEDV